MGAITLIAAVVLYGLCFYMSYKAADIFNQVVADLSRYGHGGTPDGDARRNRVL